MSDPIRIDSPEALSQLSQLSVASELTSITDEQFHLHRPDEHWVIAPNTKLQARASLWWCDVPDCGTETPGIIGHFAATDPDTASQLLKHAHTRLVEQGCTLAIGPMDGNTWRRYRFLTERGDTPSEPPFFLEPNQPDDWPRYFVASGFEPLAHYTSAIVDDLSRTDPRLVRVTERLKKNGIHIRQLNSDAFASELDKIFDLSVTSFADNFLYTDIDKREFLTQYAKIEPHVRPELVLLAEQSDRLVGFMFAIPDMAQAQRGETIDRVILKTVARLPERSCSGLGHLLVEQCQLIARDLGYKQVIHALMHESNRSTGLSANYGRTFRGYTLYQKALRP